MITFEEVYEAIERKFEEDMKDFISHDDMVAEALENIDSYNGVLGDDRYYPMDLLDELFIGKSASEILGELANDFNYNDDYLIATPWGIKSTCTRDYVDDLGAEYVIDILTDNANHAESDELNVIIDSRDCANTEIKALEESEYYTESDLQEELKEIIRDYKLDRFI